MRRSFPVSRVYPALILAGTAVVVYLLIRDFDGDRLARTLAATIFTVTALLQAILLFTQTEFAFDEATFATRQRRMFRTARLVTVPLEEIERVRIRGSLVRVKLGDGVVVMVKLLPLSRAHRREALAWFRDLPQHVDDPFGEARATPPERE